MILWNVITLVGAALGIIGMYVANWAEHHPSQRGRRSTKPHDIAFALGISGWAIGVVGLVASLAAHFRQ